MDYRALTIIGITACILLAPAAQAASCTESGNIRQEDGRQGLTVKVDDTDPVRDWKVTRVVYKAGANDDEPQIDDAAKALDESFQTVFNEKNLSYKTEGWRSNAVRVALKGVEPGKGSNQIWCDLSVDAKRDSMKSEKFRARARTVDCADMPEITCKREYKKNDRRFEYHITIGPEK